MRNRILKQKERELLTNLKVSEDDLSTQNTKKLLVKVFYIGIS